MSIKINKKHWTPEDIARVIFITRNMYINKSNKYIAEMIWQYFDNRTISAVMNVQTKFYNVYLMSADVRNAAKIRMRELERAKCLGNMTKVTQVINFKFKSEKPKKVKSAKRIFWTEDKLTTLQIMMEDNKYADEIATHFGCNKKSIYNAKQTYLKHVAWHVPTKFGSTTKKSVKKPQAKETISVLPDPERYILKEVGNNGHQIRRLLVKSMISNDELKGLIKNMHLEKQAAHHTIELYLETKVEIEIKNTVTVDILL